SGPPPRQAVSPSGLAAAHCPRVAAAGRPVRTLRREGIAFRGAGCEASLPRTILSAALRARQCSWAGLQYITKRNARTLRFASSAGTRQDRNRIPNPTLAGAVNRANKQLAPSRSPPPGRPILQPL